MNCCGPTVPPPTARSKSLVETLRLLLYVQLVFGIVKLLTPGSSSFGFSDLICCLLIYQGYNSLLHYSIVMAFFFETFSFVSLFAAIGAVIQNGQSFFSNDGSNPYFPTTFSAVINLLSVALYITVMLNCFYAYREFKALAYEGLGGGFGGGITSQLMGRGGNAAAAGNSGNSGGGSYLPTTNQQQQQNARRNDDREEAEEREESNTNSAFKAFGGRGVTIG